MSAFNYKKKKKLTKIQLTKTNPKKTRRQKYPPITINTSSFLTFYNFSRQNNGAALELQSNIFTVDSRLEVGQAISVGSRRIEEKNNVGP
jgi:hypothetical protein